MRCATTLTRLAHEGFDWAAVGAALPRTVVILGLVSLLNDAASEMITPLLPIFLTATLGAGPAIVGLVEGLAEATASILKLVSGRLADRGVPAKSLVVGGYTLSNAMRPLIGLATGWGAVLGLRFLDRVGKGIRSAPRTRSRDTADCFKLTLDRGMSTERQPS